jgi:hypothetical protein
MLLLAAMIAASCPTPKVSGFDDLKPAEREQLIAYLQQQCPIQVPGTKCLIAVSRQPSGHINVLCGNPDDEQAK